MSIDIELEENIIPKNIIFNGNLSTMLGGSCLLTSGLTQIYWMENSPNSDTLYKFSIWMYTLGGFLIMLGEFDQDNSVTVE